MLRFKSFFKISLISLIFLLVIGCGGKQTESKSIAILSFGGEFAEAQRTAFFSPYSKISDTQVKEASYNGEYGMLKSAVQSGAVPWDVVDIESSALLRGIGDSIFLPIDYDKMSLKGLSSSMRHKYAVAADLYSVSLGYNTEKYPDPQFFPKTWIDFWNVEEFPGPRCLKKDPRFTLEIALLADGVALDQVYLGDSLDVERAFTSLEKIRKHVTVWWTSGHQPIQLLSSGEVAMAAAFGARMYNAKYRDNLSVNMTWNQGVIDVEYWAILKGVSNLDKAYKFIEFACQPKNQAVFAQLFPLGPSNMLAYEHIPDSVGIRLNTHPENMKNQVLLNTDYWAKNEERLRKRFDEWLTQ